MYFEGILVGELKYGSLVLVDKVMLVMMVVTRDKVYFVSFFFVLLIFFSFY